MCSLRPWFAGEGSHSLEMQGCPSHTHLFTSTLPAHDFTRKSAVGMPEGAGGPHCDHRSLLEAPWHRAETQVAWPHAPCDEDIRVQ
eukprot:11404391-Alexandrium_andersonii.AAC.1